MNAAVADNPNLPEVWSQTENIEWSTEIPGLGWSSPVVWGDRVFLTSVTSVGEFEKPKAGLYAPNGRPEPPQVDQDWLVDCLDLLIVLHDNEEESWIAALDKRTGEEVWRAARDEISSWSTPFFWEHEQRTEIITSAVNRVRSYDLDGNLLWEMNGRMSWACIPTPFSSHGLLYVNSGYFGDQHRPAYAIRPGASGDISLADGETSNEYVAWYQPQAGNYNTSPLVYGDIYYSLLDRGFFESYDALTGEPIHGRQRIKVGASFSASPWAYNGKIFAASEQGDTYVLKAGPEYEVLGVNSLGEMIMASPAIVGDRLLIRTESKIYSIRK